MVAIRQRRAWLRVVGATAAIVVGSISSASGGRSEAKQPEMHYMTKTYLFTIVPS